MTPALLVVLASSAVLQLALEQGTLTVRVPVRGEPGVPELRSAPGELFVEIPDGKLERASTTLLNEGSGAQLPVREVIAGTSRSRHRGLLTLRLREGVTLPPERVSAQISQGVLTVRVAPELAPGAIVRPERPAVQSALAPADHPPPARGSSDGAGVAASSGMGQLGAPRAREELLLRALPFLLGLGLVGWLLLRQRRHRPGEVRPGAIHIVATRALGKSQRLLVVDVDRRRFLLSASEPGGISLLAPIAGGAEDGQREGGQDGLDEVFADMLSDLSSGAAAERRTAAPVAGRADEAPRPAGRPVLQLVADPPAAPAGAAAGPTTAGTPLGTSAVAPASASGAAQGAAPPGRESRPGGGPAPARPSDVQRSVQAPAGSADVAGLLALRQQRKGAAR